MQVPSSLRSCMLMTSAARIHLTPVLILSSLGVIIGCSTWQHHPTDTTEIARYGWTVI